jgi:hypothetical protein
VTDRMTDGVRVVIDWDWVGRKQRCGDDSTGTDGCTEPAAVWVEWTDTAGGEYASVVCHRCAGLLRQGVDPNDPASEWGCPPPAKVTAWRSIEQQVALAKQAREATE